MTDKYGGIVRDTQYGDLTVFREYILSTDRIEYTIFFRDKNGEKGRADISGSKDLWMRISDDPEGPGLDGFILDTLKKIIEEGNYAPNKNYKEYRID